MIGRGARTGSVRAVWPAAGLLIGAVAVAAGRLGRRYRADLALPCERLASFGSHVAQTACGPIEYATTGEGTPILEVHGIFGGFDQGLLVARPILGNGFRIIAPSRFGYLRTPLDMFVSTPAINSGYPFGEISTPTLVVTAADDPLALPDNARRLAALIPNARLVEVERGGHLLLGQADVVGDQVRRFIREHDFRGVQNGSA